MIVDPEHDRVAALLGVYALDAVEPEDTSLVERHLARCRRCKSEVDELREAAADLAIAEGLESEQPPPGVWARIEAGLGPPGTARQRRHYAAGEPEDEPPGEIRVGPARWWTRRHVLRLGAAAAAAAALAGLSFGLVRAEDQVGHLQSALVQRGSRAAVLAALSSPGHRVTELRSRDGAAVARLVVQRNGVGYVVHSTMERLPATQTYQLWASIDGRPISLGLLGRRPASGVAFSLGTSAASVGKLMVTVEPRSGVSTPDQSPIATAPLA